MAFDDRAEDSETCGLTTVQAALLDRLAGIIHEAGELTMSENERRAGYLAVPLSERVKAYVQAVHDRGESLGDLAEHTGVSKASLSQWLRGERALSTDSLDKLCDYFEICPFLMDASLGANRPVMSLRDASKPFDDEATTEIVWAKQQAEALRVENETLRAKLNAAAEVIRQVQSAIKRNKAYKGVADA